MNDKRVDVARRAWLRRLAALGISPVFRPSFAAPSEILVRPIPSSGETIPVIGMGSWITFNVGSDPAARVIRGEVLQAFFGRGGRLIDSSPMYGSSEEVIGDCLARIGRADAVFSATKVWTRGRGYGVAQMENSRRLWRVKGFDLMQVHNLLDWETHLATLKAQKAEGRIRYIGVTTSHGRRHDLLERLMSSEPLDFVQFTYNADDRGAEKRLLPLASERGIAVIINRPFQGGQLFRKLAGKPLPEWAGEFDCRNWAQFLLKFIVSHPAVTCAIPATSRVDHMRENMGAAYGRLPDRSLRQRMVRHFDTV